MIVSSSAIRTRPEISPATALSRRSRRPRSSSRVSARAIAVRGRRCGRCPARGPRRRPSERRCAPSRSSSTSMAPQPCSTALANSSQNTSASAVARWPEEGQRLQRGADGTSRTSPWPSIASSRPIRSEQSTSSSRALRQQLVDRGDGKDPVDALVAAPGLRSHRPPTGPAGAAAMQPSGGCS